MKTRIPHIVYSEAELAWIKENASMPRREAHRAFCATFCRNDVSFENFANLCKRKGWRTGRTGQFSKGSVPANKGKKMPFNPNSAATQFKPGRLPHNTKQPGHEYTATDGYIMICIAEENPHTGFKHRFVPKHKYLWEKDNGRVPAGMCLKSKDGDRTNTEPSNWEPVPRGVLPRMNGFRGPNHKTAAPELRPVIMTLAKLKQTQHEKKKQLKCKDEHHDK